jgi:hypothetical protein
MSWLPLKKLVPAIVVCGMLLTNLPQPVRAAAPEGVIRTFAVMVSPSGPELDFLSDESLAVVVTAPENNPESFQFTSDTNANLDSRFASTVWVLQPALHITQGGASVPGSVSWLVTEETPDLPPSGAITFTGPDSPSIESQELIYIKDCTSGTCEDYSAGTLRVYVNSPGNGRPMLIVTARFSR